MAPQRNHTPNLNQSYFALLFIKRSVWTISEFIFGKPLTMTQMIARKSEPGHYNFAAFLEAYRNHAVGEKNFNAKAQRREDAKRKI
jgi:hypothetical protein